MNKFLLDTHVFIWWMEKNRLLTKNLEEILMNPKNAIFLSAASVWEMTIKKKLGKLKLPKNWKATLTESRFELLPIQLEHVFETENLPLHHKDPFDRMLVAQAKIEDCILLTIDPK